MASNGPVLWIRCQAAQFALHLCLELAKTGVDSQFFSDFFGANAALEAIKDLEYFSSK
jgi:hypothetical protein